MQKPLAAGSSGAEKTLTGRSAEPGFLSKYLFVLESHRSALAVMVILFLVLSALDLLSVGLIGPFIGAIIDPARIERFGAPMQLFALLGVEGPRARVAALGGIVVAVFVLKGLAAYGVQRRVLAFSFGFRAYLVKKLMHAYLNMPYRFYLERNSASVVQAVVHHTKVLGDDMLMPSLRFVSDSLVIVVLGAFLCWVSLEGMLLLTGILGAALFVYVQFVRPRVRTAGEEVAKMHEQVIRGVNQGIGGIKEIRTLQVEGPFFAEVARDADATSNAQLRFYAFLVVPRYLMETVLVLFVVVFSLWSIYQGRSGDELFPVLAMFGAAGIRVLPAITQVGSSLASMNYSVFSLEEVYRDLKQVEEHGMPGPAAPAARTGDSRAQFRTLELMNVGYTYPRTARPAIDSVSLSIQHGESLGIIGETGAGKTTLVDILLGLHEFDSGRIVVNGTDIEAFGWDRWRRQVAYIPQNVFLTDESLERNVAFGIPENEIDRARMERAIESAQLAGLVSRLPVGTRTVIGERGIRLSGGERQRVALARAFYHDRSIFILDEATSALDAETEKQVIEVIEKLHGQKTLFVIAHRLSTVKRCDRIVRLHAGRVVASGQFEEVVGEQNAA